MCDSGSDVIAFLFFNEFFLLNYCIAVQKIFKVLKKSLLSEDSACAIYMYE